MQVVGSEAAALAHPLARTRRRDRRKHPNLPVPVEPQAPLAPPSPQMVAYQEAQESVERRLSFFRHLTVWAAVFIFFLFTAGFEPAFIIATIWGIFLAVKGYNAILAPRLRKQWMEEEVDWRLEAMRIERRQLQGRHARSIEELSASIAHEIRNPITAAKSLVQQMGEDPVSDENIEYARVAVEELDRVERSISHLLRYAREEEVSTERVQLLDVVDSAIETFRDRIDARGVRVDLDVEADCEIVADADKLRRVVINLVSNALEALSEMSPSHDAVISISGGPNLAGDEVWLKVKDNGPGIDAAKAAKIFNPFYTSKSEGTGLGLAITKKLVEAHGGTIAVQSTPGEGTEFEVVVRKDGPTA